jgi:hypothetical protein
MNQLIPVAKDDHEEREIPTVWRMTLAQIVEAFRQGNFTLTGVASVTPLSSNEARRISGNISAYGVQLGALPDSTWGTSICRWMGSYWDVLVDLSTSEGDESDLVLFCRVEEKNGQYEFMVDSVHVP